jgi:hypothetical protein
MRKISLRQVFSNGVFHIGMLLAVMVAIITPSVALAGSPPSDTFFICPSVSTHNDHGMWVVGTHGAYYVLVPTQGDVNAGSKVFLTVPVTVPDLAQIPAGWALYKDLPTYPNFEGQAVLLGEGINVWLGSPSGWAEGDMASVVNNGDGTYTVTNLTSGGMVILDQPIPLASAAIW